MKRENRFRIQAIEIEGNWEPGQKGRKIDVK